MWFVLRRFCMTRVVHVLSPALASRSVTQMTATVGTATCAGFSIISNKHFVEGARLSSSIDNNDIVSGSNHSVGCGNRDSLGGDSIIKQQGMESSAVNSACHVVMDKPPKEEHDAGIGNQTVDTQEALLEAVNRMRGLLRQYEEEYPSPENVTPGVTPLSSSSSVPSLSDSVSNENELEGSEELLAAVAMLLEKDDTFGQRLLASLSGDALRLLLVIGTTQEYFGQGAVEEQLRAVDKDEGDSISSQNYDAWVDTTVRERAAMRFEKPRKLAKIHDTTTPTNTTNTNTNTTTNTTTTFPGEDVGYIPWGLWSRIAWSAAVPFAAFGMLDNAILVTAGDVIDKRFAETFGISTMAAAGLGGVVSGTGGIQMHGFAERVTQGSRLARPPNLTASQRAAASRGNATRVGSALGMVVGLVLGMAPLLLLSSPTWNE